MNSRPKDPRTARNKNVLVIGGSGSGKTRYLLKPNLMQCHSSYVITDPKGSLLIECGHLLEKKKYQIRFFNTINFKKSLHYNPFHYIHSEKDILKLANVLITNTDGGQKSSDPFWRNAEMLLYCALMGYIFYEAPPHEQNFNTLVAMINAMEVREDDDNFKNPVDLLFDALEEKDPDHFAVRQYHKYKLAAGKTAMESSLLVSMHIHSLDQAEAVKTIKHKITELDRTKIEEQKKAVRAGYDMDIIPSDLATYGEEAKKLLQDLQSHNERMFLLTLVIINTADTKRQLENNVLQAQSIAQAMNCSLIRLDFQQENALVASLPLCQNPLNLCRGLTTSSVAIFVPFTTQELFQTGSEALYYGVNAMSSNLIMIDRKLLKNPNGLILGVPGSGKSFSAKREITNVFLVTNDDILICDPEAEYAPLVERLHGQVIHISPTSTDYINPLDLSMDYSDEENPLSLKSDFVLSLAGI